VEVLFAAAGLLPQGAPVASAMEDHGFAWNYTTWLNLVAVGILGLFGWLQYRQRRQAV
jgi:hypothetical protein